MLRGVRCPVAQGQAPQWACTAWMGQWMAAPQFSSPCPSRRKYRPAGVGRRRYLGSPGWDQTSRPLVAPAMNLTSIVWLPACWVAGAPLTPLRSTTHQALPHCRARRCTLGMVPCLGLPGSSKRLPPRPPPPPPPPPPWGAHPPWRYQSQWYPTQSEASGAPLTPYRGHSALASADLTLCGRATPTMPPSVPTAPSAAGTVAAATTLARRPLPTAHAIRPRADGTPHVTLPKYSEVSQVMHIVPGGKSQSQAPPLPSFPGGWSWWWWSKTCLWVPFFSPPSVGSFIKPCHALPASPAFFYSFPPPSVSRSCLFSLFPDRLLNCLSLLLSLLLPSVIVHCIASCPLRHCTHCMQPRLNEYTPSPARRCNPRSFAFALTTTSLHAIGTG